LKKSQIGVEESVVNAPRITDHDQLFKSNLTLLFALFAFLLCRRTNDAFTIDSSTPTLRIIFNEHPVVKETRDKKEKNLLTRKTFIKKNSLKGRTNNELEID
jgi:hypothetical protein